MIEIKHRNSDYVLFRSESASTIKEAVAEAIAAKANLRGANLRGVDLRGANLGYANLHGADLGDADLSGVGLRRAGLHGVNLRGANLSDADLRAADLRRGDLSRVNLRRADLRDAHLDHADLAHADLADANLYGADLSYADLSDADLGGADVDGADLRGVAKIARLDAARLSIVPETGAFEGWKKCSEGVIVRVEIPADARRSNATGRKCRAERVKVLEVIGATEGISSHDQSTAYRVGEIVQCDEWCEDRWKECAGGIHFFITQAEAEDY